MAKPGDKFEKVVRKDDDRIAMSRNREMGGGAGAAEGATEMTAAEKKALKDRLQYGKEGPINKNFKPSDIQKSEGTDRRYQKREE